MWAARGADGIVVAVKVALASAKMPRTVADEADALRAVQAASPHAAEWLVEVLDQGVYKDVPFYVMPLLPRTCATTARERPRCACGSMC